MEVTWNRTNFKRLGRGRVQVWETIFAIVVPVGLSSYVFGRRCVVSTAETLTLDKLAVRYP